MEGMGGRFDRGDAGHAFGGIRHLVGPLQRGEAGVTRCIKQQATDIRFHDDQVALPNCSYHQHGAVDADRLACDPCRLSVRGIGIVGTGT